MSSKMIPLKMVGESPPYPIATKPPSRKIKIGQVQFNTSFSNQYYFPLAAGMTQAYAKKHLSFSDHFEFTEMIYKFPKNRRELDEMSERLSDCDLVGFSNYTWGEQHSLALAMRYKQRNPNGVVVFGGPQVPDSKKQFRKIKTVELTEEEKKRDRMNFTPNYHQQNQFIDICVHGEGERVFRYILEQMAIDGCYDKSRIPSASYIDQNGIFHYNNKIERMNDKELAEAPSPLTMGVFDRLIELNPDQKWILMYETDRGCPYSCAYCDWGGATEDRLSRFSMAQIYSDIMWGGEHKIPYWFICNANFGILERDVQIAEFFAEAKARYRYPEGINTQNAKNPKKHTIQALKVLQKSGLNKAAVMSQQSLNPATLKAVRRDNMKLDEYLEMQNLAAKEGIYTMTDIIIPMPEETYQTIVSAISTLIKNGQHNRIQFNNLSILRNTEMGNPEYQEHYSYDIVRAKIINSHGKKESLSDIDEWQEMVVATNTMPAEMWLKTRTLCWATGLFYYNKLLQIPLIILHKEYGIDYGSVIKLFCEDFCEYGQFPIFAEIRNLFLQTAEKMRKGGEEFIHATQWLDIFWPPEEYALIKLCTENKLEAFFREAEQVLFQYLSRNNITVSASLLRESITLNKVLVKVPFQTDDTELSLTSNVWDIYKAFLVGEKIPLVHGQYGYTIDRTTEKWDSWEEWCEKMVWWSNRRGAYLYGNKNPHIEIAGHH